MNTINIENMSTYTGKWTEENNNLFMKEKGSMMIIEFVTK